MKLYGRTDSRWIWSYAVFGLAITLAAFAMLVFFAIATFAPAVIPAALHPATASKEILWLESGVICVAVGWSVEYRFRDLKDDVSSLAARYWRPMDRMKWCLTTLLGIGSIAGMVFLTTRWHG